jgi:hypothetical protein
MLKSHLSMPNGASSTCIDLMINGMTEISSQSDSVECRSSVATQNLP